MKRMILPFAILFATTLSIQVSAQQAGNNSQTYNIHYAQDVPYVGDQASNQKMEQLDQYFKQYVVAAKKNETAKLADLKTKITTWKTDNQSWISGLKEFETKKINQWLEQADKSLRLYDQK